MEPLPQPDFLIMTGGPTPVGEGPSEAVAVPSPATTVIAVDSGLHRAAAAGLDVDHVVGDMDSVDAPLLDEARRRGATIHRHPPDKDATDLELALDLVRDLAGSQQFEAPIRLEVHGAQGGRLDHLLGDVGLLASPDLDRFEVSARFGPNTMVVVHGGQRGSVCAAPGETVSIIPMHGTARGVTTSGLRWALTNADLRVGTTRGISNEVIELGAAVSLSSGTVVVIAPGVAAPSIEARPGPYDPTPTEP